MTILNHPNCRNPDCLTCLSDHLALGDELAKRSGVTKTDHLSQYRKWFDEKGINSETEWGWGLPFIFDELNIKGYLHEVWENDGFGQHP